MTNIYIDRKYINLIGSKLDHFKQKNTDLWNFRCPLCGDSSKNKFKARGYIYWKKNGYKVVCHNCGYGSSFWFFLKDQDVSLYNQYRLENFKTDKVFADLEIEEEYQPKPPEFKFTVIPLETASEAPEGSLIKEYVRSRLIPKPLWSDLYYTPDFKKFTHEVKPDYDKELYEDDPRMIIPLRDFDRTIFGYLGRTLNNSKLRYIPVKLSTYISLAYGLDRIDKSKHIYVFEGAIDSMFIPNSVASCNSQLVHMEDYFEKDQMTLVFDKEPRNRDIIRTIKKAIDENFNVCLLPKDLPGKDINEMILNGINPHTLEKIIIDHTYSGLTLQTHFLQWKEI